MKNSKSCYFRLLVGVMTFNWLWQIYSSSLKKLPLQYKNSQPVFFPWEIFPFLQSWLPKPRYALFWQFSNLRKWKISCWKSNFGFECFYFRGSLFQPLGTYILFSAMMISTAMAPATVTQQAATCKYWNDGFRIFKTFLRYKRFKDINVS